MTLEHLALGETGIIDAINTDGLLLQRLLDLGFVPGTRIQALFTSVRGDPVAYALRGTVLALRKCTAQKVKLRSSGRSGSCEQPILLP